ITVQRQTEYGHDKVVATLPAVVSVVEKINEPRYPSFKGIMAAKKKEVAPKSAGDLGLADTGLASALTEVVEFTPAPPRTKGEIVTDEGDGGVKIAEFLASRKIV